MRIAGIERVPAEMPGGHPGGGRLGDDEVLRRLVVDVLRGAGLSEAATITLWDAGVPDRLRLASDDPRRDLVELQNPMSAEWTAMRTLVFPGLLHSARHNLAMGVPGVGDVRGRPRVPARRARSCRSSRPAWRACWPARGPGSSRPRAWSRRCWRRPASKPSSGPPRSRSSIPGGAAAVADGFVGRAAPGGGGDVRPGGHGRRVRAGGRGSARAAARGGALSRRHELPAASPGHRGGRRRGRGCRAGRRGRRVHPAAPSWPRWTCSTSTAAPPVPEGRKSVALHLVFQSSDRTLTDAEGDAARGSDRRGARVGARRGAARMRRDELVGLLDAYFGTREVRGDEWADLFELVYPDPYWREYAEPGYEGRWNGLLVRGADEVERAATCVFPSDRVIAMLEAGHVPVLGASDRLRRRARGSCRSRARASSGCGRTGSASTTSTPRSTTIPRSRRRGCAPRGMGVPVEEEYLPIAEGIPGGAAVIGSSDETARRARGPPSGAARPRGAGDDRAPPRRDRCARAGSRWWAAEAPTARRSRRRSSAGARRTSPAASSRSGPRSSWRSPSRRGSPSSTARTTAPRSRRSSRWSTGSGTLGLDAEFIPDGPK